VRQIGIALTVAAGAVFAWSVPGIAADSGPSAEGIFKKLDKNNDGRLTRDEVGQDRVRFFERLLKQGDKDKDGVLSRDEFLAATKKRERPVSQTRDGRKGDGKRGRKSDRKRERPSPDQLFKRFDKNNDGKLTLDEFPEKLRDRMKRVFKRLGKDFITKEDLSKQRRGGKGRPNPDQLFKRFDKNNDGKLTLDEVPDRAKPFMKNLLRRAGKGEDGSLTREDFASLFKSRGKKGKRPSKGKRKRPDSDSPAKGTKRGTKGKKPAGKRGRKRADGRGKGRNVDQIVARIFSRADKNGDGKISKEEAPSRMKEHFAHLDANGDGFVDKAEFKKQLQKRSKNRKGGKGGRSKNKKKRKRPSQE